MTGYVFVYIRFKVRVQRYNILDLFFQVSKSDHF